MAANLPVVLASRSSQKDRLLGRPRCAKQAEAEKRRIISKSITRRSQWPIVVEPAAREAE
jgi:hypothetical protein